MPAEIEPPELARLIEFAERPRVQDWSLRAALVRYAQPQPQRVNDLLELVRRVDAALAQHSAVLERDGGDLWTALDGGGDPGAPAPVVGLLREARALDELGDVIAAWAADTSGERPDAEVDRVIAAVGPQLDALGVAREERQPPSRRRG